MRITGQLQHPQDKALMLLDAEPEGVVLELFHAQVQSAEHGLVAKAPLAQGEVKLPWVVRQQEGFGAGVDVPGC